MRTTQDSRDNICLFIDDLPDGGCLVSLPDGSTMNTKEMGDNNTPFLMKDGTEIFYPGWAEW